MSFFVAAAIFEVIDRYLESGDAAGSSIRTNTLGRHAQLGVDLVNVGDSDFTSPMEARMCQPSPLLLFSTP